MSSIKATSFYASSESEQHDAIQAFTTSSGTVDISARIQAMEHEHGMTSEEMLQNLQNGDLQETNTIAKWLLLLDVAHDPTSARR